MMLSRTNQQRALVALVEVLGLSVWFSATAVVPSLRSEWGIGATAAVWLTASVQIGFVAGAITSTVFNLADRATAAVSARRKRAGRGDVHGGNGLVRHRSSCGGPAEIPHRDVPGRRLSGGDEADGVVVRIRRSGPIVRGSCSERSPSALHCPHLIGGLGPLPWRTVMLAAAALTASRRRRRPRRWSGPVPIWTSARSHRIRATRSRCSPNADRGWSVSAISGTCGSSTPLWTWLSMFVVAGRAHEATRPRRRPGS